jgi:hypothetical protein
MIGVAASTSFVEEPLQDQDDELHRRVVIVQEQHFETHGLRTGNLAPKWQRPRGRD